MARLNASVKGLSGARRTVTRAESVGRKLGKWPGHHPNNPECSRCLTPWHAASIGPAPSGAGLPMGGGLISLSPAHTRTGAMSSATSLTHFESIGRGVVRARGQGASTSLGLLALHRRRYLSSANVRLKFGNRNVPPGGRVYPHGVDRVDRAARVFSLSTEFGERT